MTQRLDDDTVPRIGLQSTASSFRGSTRSRLDVDNYFSSSSDDCDRTGRNFGPERPAAGGSSTVAGCGGGGSGGSDREVSEPATAQRFDPGVSARVNDRRRQQQLSNCSTSRNFGGNPGDGCIVRRASAFGTSVLCGTSSDSRGRPTPSHSLKTETTTATTKTVIRTLSDIVRGSGSDAELRHRQKTGRGVATGKFASSTATAMTKGNGARGGSTADDLSGPSVLRALLQGSGKQAVVYQTQKHLQDARRPPPRPVPGRSGIQQPTGLSGTSSSAVTGHRSRRRSSGQSGEVQHRKAETRSEIKALLMGQAYQRVPPTTTAALAAVGSFSSDDAVDLSRRGSRAVTQDSADDGRRSRRSPPKSPPAKKLRLDNSLTHVIFQEHSLSLFLVQVVDLVNEFEDLSYSIQRGSNHSSVEIRRKGLYGVPALGLTPAQVIVEGRGYAHFVTAVATSTSVTSVQCRDVRDRLIENALRPLLFKLSERGGHVFCPGVSPELAVQAQATGATVKGLMRVELGPSLGWSPRYQAKDCPVWFFWPQAGPNQGLSPLDECVHKCKLCSGLERLLKPVKKERREADNGGSDADSGTIMMVDGLPDYVCMWGPNASQSEGEEETVLAETLH